MQNNIFKNNTTAFILTLLFPFGGLIYSLSHWRESWAKNTFWLACIYLGAVLIYWPEGTILGGGADGGEYALRLIEMFNGKDVSVKSILSNYQKDAQLMDLYQQLLTFFVSRYTDNGHVLFAVFAFVFGFFYSRNIWYVLEKLPNKKLGNLFILATLYFLICPITQINGVRMWTALHVFVYATMPYLLERDRSKLWWVILTPLIHFSYLYVALFTIVYVLLPYKIKTQNYFFTVAYILFFASLLVNSLNLSSVSDMLAEYSPETYEGRISQYVSQDVADRNAEKSALNNWYVAGSGIIKGWSYNILLLLLYPCLRRNFKSNEKLWNLYVFTLFFGAFANIMSLIPSGGRFQLVSQMFKVPIILLVVMNIPNSAVFRKYVNFATIFLLIPFVVDIRRLFDYFSFTAIFGNFITVFFWENNVPLITFIKNII